MEPVVTVISALGTLIPACYDLYSKKKLSKENGEAARTLATRLRDIKESISEAVRSDQRRDLACILTKISSEVQQISAHVSAITTQQKGRKGMLTILDAPSVATDLRDALHLAVACQARLESVELFIIQARRHATALDEWNKLFRKFEQVVRLVKVDGAVSDAFYKLNNATVTLLPAQCTSEGSTVTPGGSMDFDNAEMQSMNALEAVPAAVQALVLSASRDSIKDSSLNALVAEFLVQWDGWHIHYDQIKLEMHRNRQRKLGSGGFGTVYAGVLEQKTDSGTVEKRVAVKEIDIDLENPRRIAEIIREALLQMSLQHNCILHCYGVSLPPSAGNVAEIRDFLSSSEQADEPMVASVVTERMGCNLADALKSSRKFPHVLSTDDRVKIVIDVATAIRFLHSHHVVHRDIKPENVLLNFEDGSLQGYAKLADFGNSRRAHVEQTKRFTTVLNAAQGTPLFMPPEALIDIERCRSTKAWDIWSYGVLLCYLFAHDRTPDISNMQIQKLAQDKSLCLLMQDWASHISLDDMRSMANNCFLADAAERMAQDPLSRLFPKSDEKHDMPINERAQTRTGSGARVDRGSICTLQQYQHAADRCAVPLYQQTNDVDRADAFFNLGLSYDHGDGVKRDKARAVRLYQQAAQLGHVNAIFNLGVCYQTENGLNKDEASAAQLYERAANLGHPAAMYNLGVCCDDGKGVEMDKTRAVQWYQRAADLGHVEAMYRLSWYYKIGKVVEKDESRSMRLYRQAADLDATPGQLTDPSCAWIME